MMTDRWCFTCDHEIKQTLDGRWAHVHEDEAEGCVCIDDKLGCEPR